MFATDQSSDVGWTVGIGRLIHSSIVPLVLATAPSVLWIFTFVRIPYGFGMLLPAKGEPAGVLYP